MCYNISMANNVIDLVARIQERDDARTAKDKKDGRISGRQPILMEPDNIPFDEIAKKRVFPNKNKASHYIDLHTDLWCSTCLNSLDSCKHNPRRVGRTAEEWQVLYDAQRKAAVMEDGKPLRQRKTKGDIPEDIKQNIVRAYRAGDTIGDLAKVYKLFPAQVSIVLKDNGVTVRRGRQSTNVPTKKVKTISPELIKQIVAEYTGGSTMQTIAKMHNLLPMVISQILKKENVTIRPKGRPGGVRGRARTTLLIDDKIIAQAMKLFPKLGVVKTAKQLKVSPNELSKSLKAKGVKITRGKKK